MSNKLVIGGGYSFKGMPEQNFKLLAQVGEVYGVNDAMVRVPCHYGVTMDRLWFENRFDQIDTLTEVWVREKCDCNVKQPKRWRTFMHFAHPYPSMKEGQLHGGNSGTCAINLAMQSMLEGDTLFLFGFDMCKGPQGQPYWYPAYPWSKPEGATKQGHFNKWVKEMNGFSSYAQTHGFVVYNVSPDSQLTQFPKITLEQFWSMT